MTVVVVVVHKPKALHDQESVIGEWDSSTSTLSATVPPLTLRPGTSPAGRNDRRNALSTMSMSKRGDDSKFSKELTATVAATAAAKSLTSNFSIPITALPWRKKVLLMSPLFKADLTAAVLAKSRQKFCKQLSALAAAAAAASWWWWWWWKEEETKKQKTWKPAKSGQVLLLLGQSTATKSEWTTTARRWLFHAGCHWLPTRKRRWKKLIL